MLNIALVNDDIVTGRGDGIEGPEIPEALLTVPDARLRFKNGNIIDVENVKTFYVDSSGTKHITNAEDRKKITCNWDTKLIRRDGSWYVATDTEQLNQNRSIAKAEIDRQAERQRVYIVTKGSGQNLTYQIKYEEAVLAIDDEEPTEIKYPMLNAEVGITGSSIKEVAEVVLEARNKSTLKLAAIETVRLTAKAEIDQLDSKEEMDDLVANVVWPS